MGAFESTKLRLVAEMQQSLKLKQTGARLLLTHASSSGTLQSQVSAKIVGILEGVGFAFNGDRSKLLSEAHELKGVKTHEDLEVEVKAHLPASIDEMRQRIIRAGGVHAGTEEQETIYIDHPSLGIRESGKAFRMRITNGKTILSYKGPVLDTTTRQRVELELETDENMWKLLERIGFIKDISVAKTRDTYHLDGLEVCLDNVKELGPFIEVESKSPKDKDKILQLLKKLGVPENNIEPMPYPILLEKKKRV